MSNNQPPGGATLSTHVLDTAHGCPAAGMTVTLRDAGGAVLFAGETNSDGRCLKVEGLPAGKYAISFGVAAYFRSKGAALPDPPFLDVVSVDFGIADSGHFHVPLLVSPFSYSTYRGS